MSKATEMKRKRELVKMQKRAAKDQKRVLRKGGVVRTDQTRSFVTADSKPLTGIAQAAAQWMKPVVKESPVRSKPSVVGSVVIRRAKTGGA